MYMHVYTYTHTYTRSESQFQVRQTSGGVIMNPLRDHTLANELGCWRLTDHDEVKWTVHSAIRMPYIWLTADLSLARLELRSVE